MTRRAPLLVLLAALAAAACSKNDSPGDEGTAGAGGGGAGAGGSVAGAGGRGGSGGNTTCATATPNGACSTEGAVCGSCTDICQFCNSLRCTNGHWQGQEAAPAPCFACGSDLRCQIGVQYCQVISGGAIDAGSHHSCQSFPPACAAAPTCTCLGQTPPTCSQPDGGGVVVTVLAP